MEAKIKPQDVTTKELRQGNILMDLKAGIEIRVERILSNSIKASGANNYSALFDYDMYEVAGIELSEDWLRRMGWTKEDEGKYAKGYTDLSYCLHLSKSFDDGRYFLGIRYDDWTHDSVTVHYFTYCVKYIHQLQNAWQILTGSELTIKDINNIEVK